MHFENFIEQIANGNNIDEILIKELVNANASIDSSTVHSLVELFRIDSKLLDLEELIELTQKVEQVCNEESECYVENINGISIAISELIFLRHTFDKTKSPIDIQRFSNELVERGYVIHPVTPLLAAFHYLFIATNTRVFSNNTLHRIGELKQSANLARMSMEIIYSNASKFNNVVKDGNIAPMYKKLESEIKNQVGVLLTNEPECKQVVARMTKWLKEKTNDPFILDDAPKKWFKRIVHEEKYFFEEISHFPTL